MTGGTGAISLPVLVSDMPATIGFDAPVLSDDPGALQKGCPVHQQHPYNAAGFG